MKGSDVTTGIESKPSLAMFGKRGSNGWAIAFVINLVQGEPRALPDDHQDEGSRAALYNAAKSRNFKVNTLTYNGKIWAVKTSAPVFQPVESEDVDEEEEEEVEE